MVKLKRKFNIYDCKLTKLQPFCPVFMKNAIFDFFMPQFPGKQQQISFNSRLTNPQSLFPKPNLQPNLHSPFSNIECPNP